MTATRPRLRVRRMRRAVRFACDDLDRLPFHYKCTVITKLCMVADSPTPHARLKKLTTGKRRLRVGKYRVFVCIDHDAVTVTRIAHRKNAYRRTS